MIVQFNVAYLHDFIKKSKFIKNNDIKILAYNNVVMFFKSDGEKEVSRIIQADVSECGSIILNKNTLKLIKDDGLLFINNNEIQIDSQIIKLNELSSFYFDYDQTVYVEKVQIEKGELKHLLEVSKALSKDAMKPALHNILMKGSKFAALDGYRLSERTIDSFYCDDEVLLDYSVLKNIKNNVTIHYNNENVKYVSDDYVYIHKRNNSEYVNINSLKPTAFDNTVEFDAKELTKILKTMKNTNVVYLDIKNNIITITTTDDNVKTSQEIKCKNQYDIEIAFNPKYLLDAIKDMKGETTLYLNTNVQPVVIKDTGKYELLLPVRIAKVM